MYAALLHHISRYTSIGDCGQLEYSSERCEYQTIIRNSIGSVMASDVYVICLVPSGSSVINLTNQTNPDINYHDLERCSSNTNGDTAITFPNK